MAHALHRDRDRDAENHNRSAFHGKCVGVLKAFAKKKNNEEMI
jgi:hypothetical protein